MIVDIQQKLGQPSPPVLTADDTVRPIQDHMGLLPPSDMQVPAMTSQESVDYFQDPSLAELNASLFEMDWGNVDWRTMSGLGWT
jgi:hypothetical protein